MPTAVRDCHALDAAPQSREKPGQIVPRTFARSASGGSQKIYLNRGNIATINVVAIAP